MTDLERRRIANLSRDEVCPWCEDGLALVAWRPTKRAELPEYGPCPWCELGLRMEFPTGKKGPKGDPGAKPSWGVEGYWRGRTPVVERPPASHAVLSPRENALRVQLLGLRYGGKDADPLVALDEPNPAARIGLLEAELIRVLEP